MGLQGTFPRCKKRLPGNSKRRMLVIESIVLVQTLEMELYFI
jgi:hypothetical protein